jgi:DNA-binding NtrC family response regulator
MTRLTSREVELEVSADGHVALQTPLRLPPGRHTGVLVLALEPEREEPPRPESIVPLAEYVEHARREHVMRALQACGGNRTRAARLLGVDVRTVFRTLAADEEDE